MVVPHGSICLTTRIRWGFIVFDMFYKGLLGFGFSRLRQLTGIAWDLPADLGRVDLTLRGTKVLATLSPPDPREDLESRSPNLGPYTTKGTL